jgi:uncharacterized repeat protein (TIGR03803 family)
LRYCFLLLKEHTMLRTSAFRIFVALLFPALFLQNMLAQATETTIYTFCEQGGGDCYDGKAPWGNIAQGPDGNFYGTTETGGSNRGQNPYGTIFKVTPGVGETILHNFTDGTDGANPLHGLILAGDGNFYGTTEGYTPNGIGDPCPGTGLCGTIFRITPSGSFSNIYTFCSQVGCPDGYQPTALTLGSDGNLYGSSVNNFGDGGIVDVFKVTLAGIYTLVGQFDGYKIGSPLLQATDGNFYTSGLLSPDISGDNGGILQITPSGNVSYFYAFPSGTSLPAPAGSLIEDSSGNLYGAMSVNGTADGPAEIFKVTPGASMTTLATYCPTCGGEGYNSLLFGSDGNIYGAAEVAGANTGTCDPSGCGTVFQVTPTGTVKTLYSFTGGAEGVFPLSGLVEAGNGSFYGTNTDGGGDPALGSGTLYEISLTSPPPAPITITVPQPSLTLGSQETVNWSVLNAFSETMQQCYGFSTLNGVTTALGKMTGTYSNGVYSGSSTFAPTTDGTYTLALSCGGVESGSNTVTVTGSGDAIEFSSVTHNFGTILEGTSSTYGVKVTNANSAAFPFHLTLSGANAFSAATNCGTSLRGNSSCEIEFTFDPNSVGSQTTTWSLTAGDFSFTPSNGGKLTGAGVATGSLNYTTSVHNFGGVTVGGSSPVYGTVLTNSYNFPVTLAYALSGSTTSFATNTNCGATLAAGQSCNANYTFTPKAKGFVTESIAVTASHNGSPIAVTSQGATIPGITLKGTGD